MLFGAPARGKWQIPQNPAGACQRAKTLASPPLTFRRGLVVRGLVVRASRLPVQPRRLHHKKGSFVHLTYWDDAIPKDVCPEADFEVPKTAKGAGRPFAFTLS